MHTLRALVLASLCLAACATAEAKPPVVKPSPPVKVLLDYVHYDDAKASLEAQADVQAATAALGLKQIAWQRAKNLLLEKYGIDPEAGGGWEVTPEGLLKVKRSAPPTPPKK